MKRAALIVIAALAFAIVPARAAAQVRAGDVRVFLDGGLYSWLKQIESLEGPFVGDTEAARVKGTNAGPFGNGGIGAAYALSEHLLPQLYLSLQHVKLKPAGDADFTLRQFDLRAAVEIALLPASRFVPYALAGLTLGKVLERQEYGEQADVETSSFGLGPVLGAGVHAFLTPRASLDLSLAFRATYFLKSSFEPDLGGAADYELRMFALLLNVGASFWL